MTELHVNADKGYDLYIHQGLLDHAGEYVRKVAKSNLVALITDSNVAELYAGRVKASLESAGFDVKVYAFAAGEASKNHQTLLEIYSFLAASDITRKDIIVALGGGVTGDTAGFAAATWQRGIDFVQIPTTLLAQVDSSIGGKTAVDLPEGKNLVGSFWQPSLVLCDTDTLDTLDGPNLACGMAEVIKHACIRSLPLFNALVAGLGRGDREDLIAANLSIKKDIVQRDTKENGERMLLNFGHTLGHAIEKLHDFTGVTHGEAVAIGMSLITSAFERQGLTEAGTTDKLTVLLKKYHLPWQTDLDLRDILAAAKGDKKRTSHDINLVMLKRIGEASLYRLPVNEMPAFFGL